MIGDKIDRTKECERERGWNTCGQIWRTYQLENENVQKKTCKCAQFDDDNSQKSSYIGLRTGMKTRYSLFTFDFCFFHSLCFILFRHLHLVIFYYVACCAQILAPII